MQIEKKPSFRVKFSIETVNFSEYKNKEKDSLYISFEVFPPRDNSEFEKLKSTLKKLSEFSPSLITVTHGAMGKGSKRTLKVASYLKNTIGMESACHLTCIGSSIEEIDLILKSIEREKISNIVALRGDIPKENGEELLSQGAFQHANQLVEHIKNYNKGKPKQFSIAVAGYPEKHIESPSFEDDIANLKKKVDAGADIIITQLFFDNRYYFDYVDRVRAFGIDIPVIPGLMPLLSSRQVIKISSLCGTAIPAYLKKKLESAENDNKKAVEIGITQCKNQVKELIAEGVPGIHFYVLNRASHIERILEST